MNMRAIILIALLPMAGCASMSVQVSVLNPDVVRARAETDRIEQDVPARISTSDAEINGSFGKVDNALFDARKALGDEFDKKSRDPTLPDGDKRVFALAAGPLRQALPVEFRDAEDQARAQLLGNQEYLRGLWSRYKLEADEKVKESYRHRIVLALNESDATRKSFAELVQKNFEEVKSSITSSHLAAPEKSAMIADLNNNTKPEIEENLRQIFNSGGFQYSPYAFYVASAPDDAWVKKFDRTAASGYFGNSDIAIKLLNDTSFTLKGLSFNPADVAAMAAKTLTQTLLLSAQISGVPIHTTGQQSGVNGAALANSSNTLATVNDNAAKAKRRLNAQRAALLRIAGGILDETTSLGAAASDSQRKQALDAIKAIYESQKANLTVTDPFGGAP